jgi:hypothetical protein
MIRKSLVAVMACASLALAACGGGLFTSPPPDPGAVGTATAASAVDKVVLTAKQGLTAARGAHFLFCDAVAKAHTSGVLTGSNFNKARDGCIQSDNLFDAADVAIKAGDTVTGAQRVRDGLEALAKGQAAAPGLVPPS